MIQIFPSFSLSLTFFTFLAAFTTKSVERVDLVEKKQNNGQAKLRQQRAFVVGNCRRAQIRRDYGLVRIKANVLIRPLISTLIDIEMYFFF